MKIKKQIISMGFLVLCMLLLAACDLSDRNRLTAREGGSSSVLNTAGQVGAENVQSTVDTQSTADAQSTVDTQSTADAQGTVDTQSTADAQGTVDAQSTADDSEAPEDSLFLITGHNIQNYQITLKNLTNDEQICYEYTDGTEFFDKYGNYTPREDFTQGKLAVVKSLFSNDTLGAIAFTDLSWDYEEVQNYSIDTDKKRIQIADNSYQYGDSLKIYSDMEETDIYAIGDNDILNVYGVGRMIYSIVIATGHGTLSLTNTDLFEGGWLNLGTKMYTTIIKNMTMEIPEGIYDFSVANDGYGDSGEIRIRRDKTTTIDLNDYKGEGPKLCKLTFKVGVEDAVITVDGKKVNYKKPLEIRYGVHRLDVYAEGYDAWSKQLVINSPKAKVDILLRDGQTDTNTASENEKDTDQKAENSSSGNKSSGQASSGSSRAGSKAGSLAGSSHASGSDAGSSNNSSALANAALGSSLASIITGGDSTDYLDTLSDLVDSLDKLKRPSSSSEDSSESSD